MKLSRGLKKNSLMAITVVAAISIVAATLARRPAIEAPKRFERGFKEQGFNETLMLANSRLLAQAKEVDGKVAVRADNLAIARRLSLSLVGSGLSLEEIRALSLVPEEEQIRWWTSYLLQDERWADYFAERFSRAFVGTADGPFLLFRKRKFKLWLADQFRNGVGYDEIVASMIKSDGLWTDTPQVNFLTATITEGTKRADPIALAGRTSRAFLAQGIDCLQCHDDFLGELNFGTKEEPIEGVQSHFHELAAFYSGASFDGAGFQGIREDGEAYRFQYQDEDQEVEVTPTVPFLSELLPEEGNPRERLAGWITHEENLAFSRATVNRVWALMFSRPLVEPLDDIPLSAEVPPVMDLLAKDFARTGFDMRRLVRLITQTEAFQRDSRADFPISPAHESTWAVFPLTQLRPEQVIGSMSQAGKLSAIDASSSILTRLQFFGEQEDFLKRFGDRGEDEFEGSAVTIPQRLIMMNGKTVSERTKVDLVNNASTRIATLVQDNGKAVDLAFLSVLNRKPSEPERNKFIAHLADKKKNERSRAMGDIFWAMFNSTEFSWNH